LIIVVVLVLLNLVVWALIWALDDAGY